jgi:hypothetical protein
MLERHALGRAIDLVGLRVEYAPYLIRHRDGREQVRIPAIDIP